MRDFTEFFLKFGESKVRRELTSRYVKAIVTYISLAFVFLYIYFAGFSYFSPESFVSIYVGVSIILIFLLYPMTKKSPRDRPTWIDIVLIILTVACTAYYIEYYSVRIVERMGEVVLGDTIFGILAIIVSLEACRRVIGGFVSILCVIAIIYAYVGPYIPGLLGHPGTHTEDLVSWLYSANAIYGTVASVFARFVFLFIVFGTVLEMVGGGKFFLELPLSILGRVVGGAAKLAIVASSLFGTISGSVLANVTTTGVFTIPLMKRTGYEPHMAGATEAVASTIGVTMPPVMGAAIFIMADFTGIPYLDIAVMSMTPSLLFMSSLIFATDFQARKMDLKTIPKAELPDPIAILKTFGHLGIPLIALIVLLVLDYSPGYAAFWSIILCLVVGQMRKETRYGLPKLLHYMELAVKRSLAVGGLAGAIGVIIGVVYITGIATKMSAWVVDISGGSLFFVIILTVFATFILGMGVSSITADYILLSTLLAPAMIMLGAPVAGAHLAIIWLTQSSNVTPPVCLSAFAGAALAQANPWRTGFFALRLGSFGLFLLPLTFVFSPMLDVKDVGFIYQTVTVFIAGICYSAGLAGFIVERVPVPLRIIAVIGACLLISYNLWLNIIGIAFFLIVIVHQVFARRRKKARLQEAR